MNKASLSSLLFIGLVWAAGCGDNGGSTGGEGGGGSSGGSTGGQTSDGGATTGTTSSSDGGTTSTTDTTTSTTSDTTTSTTSVTVTGNDPQAICEALCAVGKDAGCFPDDIPSCVSGCLGSYQQYPSCAPLIDAAYLCAIAKVPSGGCSLDALCGMEAQAAQDCMNGLGPGCGVGTCSGSPDSCGCEMTCNGVTNSNECTQSAGGQIACKCFVDGAQVGACIGSDLQCDLDSGCCAQFF